jgi:hypothetical protein
MSVFTLKSRQFPTPHRAALRLRCVTAIAHFTAIDSQKFLRSEHKNEHRVHRLIVVF